MGKRVTIEEAVSEIGKSRRTLERWKAAGADGFDIIAGCIYVDVEKVLAWKGSGKKAKAKKISPEPATTSDTADKKDGGDGSDRSWHAARTRDKMAAAKLKEIALKKAQGELVEWPVVESAFRKMGELVKSRLGLLSVRIAPRVARLRDEREIAKRIDAEVKNILKEIEHELGSINRG